MKINITGGELDRREVDEYIRYAYQKHPGRQIDQLDINIDGEFVDLQIHFKDMDFQHAYRSADYLVNNMEKLNDAKQSEFSQKEKHSV
ncbi:MAG: hypothetical protein IKQ90_05680 [Ruminococcus sp.]|nr:hypothetical protein [Ruminococcus sp.]